MNEVTILLGAPVAESLDAALARMGALPAWRPFDARATAFVARVSQRLLTDPAIREYPELAALGHWFRGAHLRDLESRTSTADEGSMRLGRGLAFHLAPANVDSVFMYSWLLSLLAGNSNIVRLSQVRSPQVDFLVEVLRDVMQEEVGRGVEGRLLLLTYPHSEATTRAISEAAMARLVWGGDASVAAVRAIPLRPTAIELAFPDRFSAAAFKSSAIGALPAPALARLAADFYNDTMWFSQQACSSPRMVAFIGLPAENAAARRLFWPAFEAEIERRQPENDAAIAMSRLVATFEYAAGGVAAPEGTFDVARRPQRLTLEAGLDAHARNLHCGNGLFLEQQLPDLAALARQLRDKDQTLAVAGFSRSELESLVLTLPPRAVDRIVPVGQALNFDNVWDGQDLLASLARRIVLPPA
jgi:hypothetical protein